MVTEEILLEEVPNNLPRQLATFVGRQSEITRLLSLLAGTPPAGRLITLTGVGGAGKTRLALKVAPLLLSNFPDGVWLVKLAALSEPLLIPQTIAQILGLKVESQVTPLDNLTQYLPAKQLLLILDNCEHLIGTCAELAEHLLQACPKISILATSREGLNIAGEVCFPVPALSMPDSAKTASLDEIAAAEAVQLFLQRGTAVQPNFKLSQENAVAIVQICRSLDGLPLALELAAARLKGLPLNELAGRLDDRFHLLTGGSRTALPRHQTLQALLDWSYNLLSQREQVLLRRLSGFVGSFSLEAAEAVCPGQFQEVNGWGRLDRAEVLDLLVQLVSKSLVQLEADDNSKAERRYRLLETIRHYSQDRADEANETELIRQNLLAWCIAQAEQAEPYLQGPEQMEWLQRLEIEHANFRAALGWAFKAGDREREQGLRLGGALWRFWQLHSHFSEGRQWLETGLSQINPGTIDPLIRAKALQGAGVLLSFTDYTASLAFHRQSLEIQRELGDITGQMAALKDLAWVALHHNDFEQARKFGEESLRLGRIQGDKVNIAASLFVLAVSAFFEAELSQSEEFGNECLQIWRELGDLGSVASVLSHLGMVALRQNNYKQAGSLLVESLDLNWKLSNKLGVTNCILQITKLALEQSDGVERAAKLLGWQDRMVEALGGKMPPLALITFNANLDACRSRLDENRFQTLWQEGREMDFEQAVNLAREVGLPVQQQPITLEVQLSTDQPLSDREVTMDSGEKLTRREMEVLSLVAQGLTNGQIAQKMFITSRTVNAHLTSIYAKLGVPSRSGAIRYALNHHLV